MTMLETLRLALFLVGPTCILVGLRWRHSQQVRAEDRQQRDRAAQPAAPVFDELRYRWALRRLEEQAARYGQEVG